MQQKQTASQPDHKNGHKPERAVHPEQVGELVGLAVLPGGVLDTSDLSSRGGRLDDPRLQTVQRQRIASQIGHVQGNHHLQGLIQTARNGKSHAHGLKGNGNVADAAEEGESEGLGAGGILIFNGAGLPPNSNGKNTAPQPHRIQRDDEDDRPSEEERARALAKAKVAEQAAKQTKSESQQETVKSKKAGAAEAEAGKTAKAKKEQASTAAKSLKSKKKQAAESGGEDGKARAPKGKGAGPGSGAAEVQAIVAALAGPQDKAPASPQEDPAFQAVVGSIAGNARKQQAHAPAKSKASQAQAAAVPPANETTSKAQSNQVGEMEQAQTPAFDAAAFKAQLMERITAMSPKTMKEADEFKDQNKMGSVKGEMQNKVSQEKTASQGPLEEKTKAAPDESGIPPKPVTDLQPAQAGAPPGKIGAEGAAPKPKTSTEVEQPFQESSQSIDQQMADEHVTEQQLAKSNEPEFQGALSSKQEAQTHAAQAPQDYRAYEGEQVEQAKSQAAGTAQAQLEGMHGDRAQALTQVMGQQTGAKGQDEAARAKVAGDIQQIYDKTKSKVEAILTQLDTDVSTTFDAGARAATQAFEEYVDSKMEAYKEDRYGGWFGWARWLKDKVRGMPSEVNVFYADGRNLFLKEMDAVINNVVQIIGRGLTEAKAEVANGRKEIQSYVTQLPEDLQKVGKQAASDIQDKFDELESSIDAKQNALVEELASKYNEKLQAVDSRIEELKAANQGLIDKAINAVVGVIKVIKKLKDMITNILSRIADLVMGIISDPIGFLGNMIDGIKLGLNNFISNLPKHLINALLSWLTSALGPVGIKLPNDILSLEGIFSLVMQLLGLTWDAIRAKAVKLLGEPVVKALETGFEIFQVLVTEGPIGLWKYVKEMFGNLKEMVIDAITDMIKTEVVQAGIKWIMGLLTPAGAFIKAAMAIYDIVKFFIEKASQIGDLINAIIDSIAAIAKGGISAAGQLIENALAKALPVVIGFLASLIGIGDVGKKVQGLIEKIRGKIDKAVDWVIMKAKAVAGKVMGKLGVENKEDGSPVIEPASEGIDIHTSFETGDEQHEINSRQGSAVLILSSSTPTLLDQHPDKEVRKAYTIYLQEVAAATSPTGKKKAANRNLTIIVEKIKAAGPASLPRASAPGIGAIKRHKNQQKRLKNQGISVWETESEHVIPRAFVNAAFEALAQAGVPAAGPDYDNMHTILIYVGAAHRKTEGPFSDQSKINNLKEAVVEMREEVEVATKPSSRARARDEMARAILDLLSAFSSEAESRTNEAIIEENRLNRHARGPVGKPEAPTPTPGQVNEAYNAQRTDINEQLQARIDRFLATRKTKG